MRSRLYKHPWFSWIFHLQMLMIWIFQRIYMNSLLGLWYFTEMQGYKYLDRVTVFPTTFYFISFYFLISIPFLPSPLCFLFPFPQSFFIILHFSFYLHSSQTLQDQKIMFDDVFYSLPNLFHQIFVLCM